VVGLSLFLALGVGLLVWLTHHDSTYHAPLDRTAGPHADPGEATTLLDDLQSAVRRRDVAAGTRLGATPGEGADLAGVVRNARAAQVTGFDLRYIDTDGVVAADGSWAADVATTWRFAGFDRRAEHLDVRVRFARVAGVLRIAGIGGGGHRTPVWLSGPLQVRRTSTSMVLVAGSAEHADAVAALARRAVPQVRRVLPDWGGGLVIEAPATQSALEAALGADSGQYDGIAAVTTTPDGSRSRQASSHVFLNPPVFDPLRPQGAQVVVTHEATHVATAAASSPAPIWLVEGFADYVALSSQSLPLSTTAARIIALVRHDGAPRHLPGRTQFAAGARNLEARYESAWLACRLLAQDGGPDALVAFYRAMDGGGALAPELRRHFGLTPAAFTRQWRTLLSHVAA
jgi:hypothetical protein